MSGKHLLLLYCALLVQCWVHSQPTNLKYPEPDILFHRITSEDGLPHDIVHSIIQDKKGFIWIGTANGLCRYDGSKLISFRNDPKDSLSLGGNNVRSLDLDANGRIWAGTFWKGLNLYDPSIPGFKNYVNEKAGPPLFVTNSIFSFKHIDNNHVAVAQANLMITDLKNKQREIISLPKNTWTNEKLNKVSDTFTSYKIFIDHEKKWWLCGEAGIVKYDPSSKKMMPFGRDAIVPEKFRQHSTWDCTEDKLGNIWVGSGAGLFEFNRASQEWIQHFPSALFTNEDRKSLWVKSVLCASNGTIWFGTENGLYNYSPQSKSYAVYRNNPEHSLSISNNDILVLFEDRQQIIWIGTANGLNAVFPKTSPFAVIQNIPGKQGLQTNTTRQSFKDPQGNIWIATSEALECIDAKTKFSSQYRHLDKKLTNAIEYNAMTLLQQDASTCWVGTWGEGLQLFDFVNRKFIRSYVHTDSTSSSICSNFIKSICKDDKGNLWIATWNGGIDKLDIKKQTFEHYNTHNRNSGVNSDYLSKIHFYYGTIWAGNSYGLLKYDYNKNSFSFLKVTSDTLNRAATGVTEIKPDGKGNLWLGAIDAIHKFNTLDNSYVDLPTSGRGAMAIHVSPDGSLWLAGHRGLEHFFPATSTSRFYSLRDGLPITYFPLDCYIYECGDGEIMVNSNNGLIRFHPDKMPENNEPSPLYLTSVKIQNKDLKGTGDVTNLKNINLRHNQNYLTFAFAALNFINPTENLYSYKLEGFDHEWIEAGNRNEVIYTNLAPGNYVFKVKATNGSGVPTNNLEIGIYIKTPWWRTIWFYLLVLLFASAIIYSIYKIRIERVMAEQRLRNKIARDLHDDIGSTLSGIKLFSGMALQKLVKEKSETVSILERIGERSGKMMDAMSDIVWSIQSKNDELEDIVFRMKTYTAEMLEPKNIEYEFVVNEKEFRAKMLPDMRKEVYLIFKEIINNIVKHASAKSVRIEVRHSGKLFIMKIADDGSGFDYNSLKNGNGLANMKERAKKINGKLNLKTSPEMGTIIDFEVKTR